MAEENEEVEKKEPSVILIVIISILLTAVVVVGVLYALKPGFLQAAAAVSSEGDTGEKSEAVANPKAPTHKIVEVFDGMVRLKDGHHLNFRLVADIPNVQTQIDTFNEKKDVMQNEIIMYVSNQNENFFVGRKGKMSALGEIKSRLNKVNDNNNIKVSIKALYFSKFELP